MQNFLYSLALFLLFISCKELKPKDKAIELSVAEKIANAHGFEQWKNVSEIAFTFNGRRSWLWNPGTNAITYTKDTLTITYNRTQLDSTVIPIDRAFINDKFWLLIPFQLVWDKGLSISDPVKAQAPISQKLLNKITLSYSNVGGYTPGDGYDIFFNDDYIIEEWIFRKGNKDEPSLMNTFENYKDFNGIKIAMEHKNAEGNWNLTFTDVKITLKAMAK
ncbi:hypothetical protein [Aestuariivivens sediminicola]|uniref:hypothetical protein n=1 Tax=Aestuariivivens sediminicola TaxID=2913560 RepID=UPI001F56F1A3|nr:hypothetical protein [Aestuariivivens sediminicola]